MKLVLAGDSAGQPLIDILKRHLAGRDGLELIDVSLTADGQRDLYASMAERAAALITSGQADRGILACGTGIGVAMSANKVRGIRAAQTHDTYSAERAALSNDAHIITMGARVIGSELAKAIADTWLGLSFDPASPSAPNVQDINRLDAKYARAA